MENSLALGFWLLAFGFWLLAFWPLALALGSWFLVLGSWFLVLSFWLFKFDEVKFDEVVDQKSFKTIDPEIAHSCGFRNRSRLSIQKSLTIVDSESLKVAIQKIAQAP